jgi:hypothetical protein
MRSRAPHLYIDGSGEVCPCILVPLSFGNLTEEPFERILDQMGRHFRRPRTGCVARVVSRRLPTVDLPARPELPVICDRQLPRTHELPRFFRCIATRRKASGGPGKRGVHQQVAQTSGEVTIVSWAGSIANVRKAAE